MGEFPRTAISVTFSPNAIGVGANEGHASNAPTPMALGLNVEKFHVIKCDSHQGTPCPTRNSFSM